MKRLLLTLIISLAGASATTVFAEPVSQEIGVQDQAALKVEAGAIELSVSPMADAPAKFEIFGITGQQVAVVSVSPGDVRTVELRRGCYIVRTVGPEQGKVLSKRITVK